MNHSPSLLKVTNRTRILSTGVGAQSSVLYTWLIFIYIFNSRWLDFIEIND